MNEKDALLNILSIETGFTHKRFNNIQEPMLFYSKGVIIFFHNLPVSPCDKTLYMITHESFLFRSGSSFSAANNKPF